MKKYQVTYKTVKGLSRVMYIEASNKADARTKVYQEGAWKITGVMLCK